MNTLRKIYHKSCPDALRKGLGALSGKVLDIIDPLITRGDLVPPRKLRFVGHGDFKKTGEEFLGHFIKVGGLQPSHNVLDVGSGIGRMAIPLTHYLSPEACYDGLEIVPAGVEWCASEITPRYPNFKFHWIDVYNFEYNPSGKQLAKNYRFPFEAGRFDFSFLTSVFTHMLPEDVENYISELGRVTKRGGRCLATFFLLNDASRAAIKNGECPILDFRFDGPGYLTVDEKMPECAIAFPETTVFTVFEKHGFRVVSPVYYGGWSGRANALSYQDIVVLEKIA